MPKPEHQADKNIARGSASVINLPKEGAAAMGVLHDEAKQGSLKVRSDNLPSYMTTRLGRTTVSLLQIGDFEASLPHTPSGGDRQWLSVLIQDTGTTRFENEDHSGLSTPGQIVIRDSNKETAISSRGQSTRIVASVPKSALPMPVLRRISDSVNILEPGPGLVHIFAQFMRATCRSADALSSGDKKRLDRTLLYWVTDMVEICGEPLKSKGARSLAQTRSAALHIIETDTIGLTSTAELAEQLSCSERQLFLAFRDSGFSPGRYIQMTRLRRARLAIETSSETSITEIAYASGFQSYAHFSRLFKQAFGITPRSLRKSK